MNPNLIHVIKADYVADYVLQLTFSDGLVKNFDFWPLAQEGICTKLQDMDYFRAFRLDSWTVDWNNEIGFAPEYLYEHSVA